MTIHSAEQKRRYAGPALLTHGFRPFFLGACAWAALAMALWLPLLAGTFTLPSRLAPLDWHVHEMLFGFLPAVISGFLLTAVPNWTGRLPVVGGKLAGLVGLWLLGRGVTLVSGLLPLWIAISGDMLFLITLSAVMGREIAAGRNWKNLPVLGLVGLVAIANLIFQVEAAQGAGTGGVGMRLAIAAAIQMIALIGGRIVPSFTRNWLMKRPPGPLPAPMNRFDVACLIAAGAALLAWVALPDARVTGILCLTAGGLHLARLGRWAGWRCGGEALVWVLHAAYLWVPLGFLLLGAAILHPLGVPVSAALHGWLAGAIGTMTLAVMTRASLGHSGRPLTASRGITALYVAVLLAAPTRILYGFVPDALWLLHLSATAWIAAFAGFVVIYTPLLTRTRAG